MLNYDWDELSDEIIDEIIRYELPLMEEENEGQDYDRYCH